MREMIMDFEESVGQVLSFICLLLMILTVSVFTIFGFYHVFLEDPPERETLPRKVMIYDRSNKAIVLYSAICEVDGEILNVYDATEMSREDVSHLVE